MVTQTVMEMKEHFAPPRIIPIEGVIWLILSLLCWCIDSFSGVACITTLHLIVRIYLDAIRKNTPSDDPRYGDRCIWRNSTATTSNTHYSGRDDEGKYLSIALIPILLESMNVLLKHQYQANKLIHNDLPAMDYDHVSTYWHNVALIVSLLQIMIWSMDSYYRNTPSYWTQQKLMHYQVALILFVLLLLVSCVNQFQKHDAELWFCYFWISILVLLGPFRHSSLQGIMTCGEWAVISCCFAFVGTSIWTAVLKEMKYFILQQNTSRTDGNEINSLTSVYDPSPMIYAFTATAGVFGCIIACSTVNHLLPYKTTKQIIQQNCPSVIRFCHSSIITNTLRIVYISFTTLGVVEGMFWYFRLTPQHTFLKCIWWILNDFLFVVETLSQDNHDTSQETYATLWFPFVAKKLPRISWLIYWFMTMLVTIPLAPTTGQISPVIARKWFHFIAILLFVPTTALVPQLQSLSYAVAICVLLMIEVIRIDIPMLNDFYYTYLDQTKDEADDSKFVISHIALVAGCAMPLWIIQYYNFFCAGDNTSLPFSFNVLVGLWGVWVLGIGDAMGAIIGKSFGRYKWGSNSRTMEGSMAMFLSLCLSCGMTTLFTSNPTMYAEPHIAYSVAVWLPAVLFVTLIEAYTLQIDNIVLPLAGVTMMLACQSFVSQATGTVFS